MNMSIRAGIFLSYARVWPWNSYTVSLSYVRPFAAASVFAPVDHAHLQRCIGLASFSGQLVRG